MSRLDSLSYVVMQLRPPHQHGARRRAGINPHVQRVVGFGGGFRAFPILRLHERPKFGGGFFEPDVRAVFFNQIGGVADDLGVEDRFAFGVVKRGNRHAPGALARDAPVGTRLHRAFDAVDAPVRHPFDAVNFGEGGGAEGLWHRPRACLCFSEDWRQARRLCLRRGQSR